MQTRTKYALLLRCHAAQREREREEEKEREREREREREDVKHAVVAKFN